MTRPRSIALGLALRLLIGFALAPVAAIVVLVVARDENFEGRVDLRFEREADIVAGLIDLRANDGPGLDLQGVAHDPGLAAARFEVFGPDGPTPIGRWPRMFTFRNWEVDGRYETVRQTPHGLVRIVFAPAADDWGSWAGWLGEELASEILPLLAVMMAVMMPLAIHSVWRSLRPVKALADQAAAIEPGTGGARLNESRVPSELRPLVKAVNATLERLDLGFAAQRDFAARAAHELRTPLAVLAASLGGSPLSGNVDRARVELRRIARLVDQLLIISELASKRLRVDESLDLVPIARESVGLAAPAAIAAGVDLALEAPAGPVNLQGNAAAVGTALRNLLENAIRHSPPGATVTLRVEAQGPALEVADFGPGIPCDRRQTIFSPFSRGADQGGAAGLGLAIVEEMARLHDGRVSVSDNVPTGAVFRIEFPPAAV